MHQIPDPPVTVADKIRSKLLDPKVTDWLGVATIVVVVLLFALVGLIGSGILGTTSALEDSTDLTGCRATYSAEVTNKRTEFDIARSHRDTAAHELSLLTNQITEDGLLNNGDQLPTLQPLLDPARQKVRELNKAVEDADAALLQANAEYQDAVTFSRVDPSKFLASCRSNDS